MNNEIIMTSMTQKFKPLPEITLFDSKTKQLVQFCTLEDGVVKIYVCGPTVQSSPHIGHMRVAVAFDIICRFFRATGYEVIFVQNVTDIDDKILAKATENSQSWQELARLNEIEFFQAYKALNVLLPNHIPHATKYIDEQINLIKRIVNNEYAYITIGQDNNSNVWFDTTAWQMYGELTNQTVDADLQADEAEYGFQDKKSPRDFALWKSYNTTDPEDAAWDSPWGRGRPGWHIECSAMATSILGSAFDIHGGGLDLRFPHHENELAQSRAAGDDFSHYWMHSAWVTSKGEKMSKSLGNGLNVSEIIGVPSEKPLSKSITQNPTTLLNALALRYSLSAVQYRSMLEWTPETLPASRKAIERIYNYLRQNCGEKYTDDLVEADNPANFPEFYQAMCNDFNTSTALGIIHTAMKKGEVPVLHIRRALQILGIDPMSSYWQSAFVAIEKSLTSQLSTEQITKIEQLILQRKKAKENRNFVLADNIRKQLNEEGIELTDTTDGTSWSIIQ